MAGYPDPDDAQREDLARMRAERDEALSAHARVCDALEAKRRRVEALEEGLRARLNDPTHAVRELARALLATEETTR